MLRENDFIKEGVFRYFIFKLVVYCSQIAMSVHIGGFNRIISKYEL